MEIAHALAMVCNDSVQYHKNKIVLKKLDLCFELYYFNNHGEKAV